MSFCALVPARTFSAGAPQRAVLRMVQVHLLVISQWPCYASPQDSDLRRVKVAQSHPTLCNPMAYRVHGILQARVLEWLAFPSSRGSSQPRSPVLRWILHQLSHKGSPRILERLAYPFSGGSSRPRNWTGVSCVAGGFFTSWAVREAQVDVTWN